MAAMFAVSNSLNNEKIFQSVHGILGHHDLHGPKGGNRFAGLGNNLPELLAFVLRNHMHRRETHHASCALRREDIKKANCSIHLRRNTVGLYCS